MTGGCACGAVRYSTDAEPEFTLICHCRQCQKASGGGFLTVLPVHRDAVTIDDRQGLLCEYRASPGKGRWFCRRCGTPVHSCRDGSNALRLRAGLFEALPGVAQAGHIFVAEARAWDTIYDTLPAYEGFEPARQPQASNEDRQA